MRLQIGERNMNQVHLSTPLGTDSLTHSEFVPLGTQEITSLRLTTTVNKIAEEFPMRKHDNEVFRCDPRHTAALSL